MWLWVLLLLLWCVRYEECGGVLLWLWFLLSDVIQVSLCVFNDVCYIACLVELSPSLSWEEVCWYL